MEFRKYIVHAYDICSMPSSYPCTMYIAIPVLTMKTEKQANSWFHQKMIWSFDWKWARKNASYTRHTMQHPSITSIPTVSLCNFFFAFLFLHSFSFFLKYLVHSSGCLLCTDRSHALGMNAVAAAETAIHGMLPMEFGTLSFASICHPCRQFVLCI